jgi:3-isopropylmalate/(R)-2-methylmalate dehydratase small subunit
MAGRSLIVRGRVRAVLGCDVDTDVIYPGRYLNVTDREKTAEHLFELAYPELRGEMQAGDILVAGKNFGCGSSREQAAAALKYAGAGAVIAVSFARIFYRNCINLGLPVVVSPDAWQLCGAGDELEIDLNAGEIRNLTANVTASAAGLDPRAVELLAEGGLIPYLKKKYGNELARKAGQGAD